MNFNYLCKIALQSPRLVFDWTSGDCNLTELTHQESHHDFPNKLLFTHFQSQDQLWRIQTSTIPLVIQWQCALLIFFSYCTYLHTLTFSHAQIFATYRPKLLSTTFQFYPPFLNVWTLAQFLLPKILGNDNSDSPLGMWKYPSIFQFLCTL